MVHPMTTEINCAWCGDVFAIRDAEWRRQRKKGREHFFCGRSCAAKSGNERKRNKPLVKTCPHCNRTFESDTGAKAATFCSRSCASAGSVTEARREAGRRIRALQKTDIHRLAAMMRRREAWRYEQVEILLRGMGHDYVFEHPIEGVGIFDLALFALGTLVEFDGPYHNLSQQRSIDEEKDRLATKAGWTVKRVATKINAEIPLSAVTDILGIQ